MWDLERENCIAQLNLPASGSGGDGVAAAAEHIAASCHSPLLYAADGSGTGEAGSAPRPACSSMTPMQSSCWQAPAYLQASSSSAPAVASPPTGPPLPPSERSPAATPLPPEPLKSPPLPLQCASLTCEAQRWWAACSTCAAGWQVSGWCGGCCAHRAERALHLALPTHDPPTPTPHPPPPTLP